MPVKEDEFAKSTRRGKRQKRRSLERKEKKSLADAATPVDSTPTITNPKDDIQDSKLPPVQEHVVTAAAASTIQQSQDKTSDSDSDSDTSEIIRRRIHLSTQKKKKQEE